MAATIMAWSECTIKIGPSGASGAMGTTLTSVGIIKDKSSSLEPSDGEVLEAKKTGGKTVAREQLEGGFLLKTRVIEPADALLTLLGLGEVATNDFNVKTHVPAGNFSVEVVPRNVGAKGIKAPWCTISYKPGWSEEEGNFADLEISILQGEAGYWYARTTKVA